MGAGASTLETSVGVGGVSVNNKRNDDEAFNSVIKTALKKLPDAIEEAVYVHEKFPLIIDPSEQAARFLKYQNGPFLSLDDPVQGTCHALNRALVASIQNGRTFTVKVQSLEGLTESTFEEGTFPKEILSRDLFFMDKVWPSVFKKALNDPDPSDVTMSPEFAFIICTPNDFVPPELAKIMCVIRVQEAGKQNGTAGDEGNGGDADMDAIAELYGAKEIVRNSKDLVEAAFDGDLEEVKSEISKGYHLESEDGRKHTALSEAACQGHINVINFLLESGADPNSKSDTGRSPLWRAAFNQHFEAAKILLEAGGDPDCRDKVSMESVGDVAQTEEIRELLVGLLFLLFKTIVASIFRCIFDINEFMNTLTFVCLCLLLIFV